jgi:hypothetical protein
MQKVFVLLVLLFSSNIAKAAIIDFHWNAGWQDIFSGYVDTKKNSLFINKFYAWTPGLNHYSSPLLPDFSDTSLFPNNEWELRAITADGSGYDIEDNWNGMFGDTWGFASDLSLDEIKYTNGMVPKHEFFGFYAGIGITKMHFNLTGHYSYYPTGASRLYDKQRISSAYSFLAIYSSFPFVPERVEEFTGPVDIVQSSGSHTIQHRNAVSESSPLLMLLCGALLLAVRKSLLLKTNR